MMRERRFTMGANSSYNIAIGGVTENLRTHDDSHRKILNHKVLLQKKNSKQAANIVNSNSESPIYIIGRELQDGTIKIHSVNVFEGHCLKYEINIKYDRNGKILAYDGTEGHTHCHTWSDIGDGNMRRNKLGSREPVPKGFVSLLEEIVKFNSQRKTRK